METITEQAEAKGRELNNVPAAYVPSFSIEELGLNEVQEQTNNVPEVPKIELTQEQQTIKSINESSDLKYLSQFVTDINPIIFNASMERIKILRSGLLESEIKDTINQIVYDNSIFDKDRDSLNVEIDFIDLIERYKLTKLIVSYDFIERNYFYEINSSLITKSAKKTNGEQKEHNTGTNNGLRKTVIFKDNKIIKEFESNKFSDSMQFISNLMNAGNVSKLCYMSLHHHTSNITNRQTKIPDLVKWNNKEYEVKNFFETFINLMKTNNISITYYYNNGTIWNSSK